MRPIKYPRTLFFVVGFARAQTRPTLETYINQKLGFKIQYLSIWKVKENPKSWIVVRFAPPEGSDSQTRAAVAMPQPKDRPGEPVRLDDIARDLINEMKTDMPDAQIVIATDTRLGGERARRTVLTGHLASGAEMKLMVVATVHDGLPYVVGVMGTREEWDRIRDGFDHLIDTFAFIEKKQ
jgi:hypothetical protein